MEEKPLGGGSRVDPSWKHVRRVKSFRSKLLKWRLLLLYQILCYSDQRLLRYKLKKFGNFPIYRMEKWAGGYKLSSNMAASIF